MGVLTLSRAPVCVLQQGAGLGSGSPSSASVSFGEGVSGAASLLQDPVCPLILPVVFIALHEFAFL